MISFVYLDVGGVADIDFSGNEQKWQELRAELGVTSENEQKYLAVWDRYLPTICTTCDLETVVKAFRDEVGLDLPDDYSLMDAFVKRFEPNPSIWPVVQTIKRAVPVGLLTNMYVGMLDAIFEANILPPVEWDVIVDSSVELCQKPERKIFEIAQKKAGVPASEILFVDNSAEHVAAAKQLGWQTLLYDTASPKQSSERLLAQFQTSLRA